MMRRDDQNFINERLTYANGGDGESLCIACGCPPTEVMREAGLQQSCSRPDPYSSLALVSVWCPCRRFGRDRGGPRVIYSGTPVCLRTVGALSRASVTWRPPTWSESLWPS